MADVHSLEPFFRPGSIAILGASEDFVKISGRAHEVAELDINPLLVLPAGRGAVAVDALAIFD